MNGKFVMEVTVPQLQHPLLYERLRACASPRERAAVFRALAEAQLRGDHSTSGSARGHGESDVSSVEAAFPPPPRDTPARSQSVSATAASTPTATPAITAAGFEPVRVDDSDSSGAVFGSYLESAGFL
ncbi:MULTISPECIES: hypothetical protein [unclassified Paraburkholderia]|uniref:hypothetical protein n=1 Tax=unclassified Paraburkholderia TaxID=2615204 RepID=UPI002AB1CB6C|nr:MULTISPECIES: hypothetical protein [unclassified Paraburkholderia]